MTETEIAEKVGTSQPSINRIKKGDQEPSYTIGAAIVALRDKTMQKARA